MMKMLKQIDLFFEMYGEILNRLEEEVMINGNALYEIWKMVSKLAVALNREIIVLMRGGEEIVLGVTERKRKFASFWLVAEFQEAGVRYYSIKSSKLIQEWKENMSIKPAIDVFEKRAEEVGEFGVKPTP